MTLRAELSTERRQIALLRTECECALTGERAASDNVTRLRSELNRLQHDFKLYK